MRTTPPVTAPIHSSTPRACRRLAAAVAILSAIAACGSAQTSQPKAVDRAPPQPETKGERTDGARSAPTPQVRRYELARQRSRIRITAGSILGDHPVTVERFTASARVVELDLTKSQVEVALDTRSVSASTETLTRILKSPRVLDVERFPEAKFVAQEIRRSSGGRDRYAVRGKLTLHGVTRNVEVPAQLQRMLGAFVARSEFMIRRQDYGIVPGGLLDVLVHDDVLVNLELVAVPVEDE